MTLDLAMEGVRFSAMLVVIVVIAWFGVYRSIRFDRGINVILAGFVLLFLGALIDVADDYPELGALGEVLSTRLAEFFEKEVGYLGGMILLAIGFGIWFPKTQALAREIDQRKRTEAILGQSQKMEAVGQMTGGVAHDFNNLLAVILGNLELLRERQQDQKGLEHIEAAIDATHRGAELTRNMLSFARKAPLVPQPINLNQIVAKTKSWIQRTLPANIAVETSLMAGIWEVEADPASTESAILNLILNARDAMPDGGKLTIETANLRIDDDYVSDRNEDVVPGRYVMVAVSDTGVGIPEHQLEAIFEPFFTTKGPASGSGLGLSMIQGFMKQSGGTVRVYSEDGDGTTFKLYFRANSNQANGRNSQASSDTPHVDTLGIRVLVTEDEPSVMNVICEALESAGYSVLRAYSGDEALELFEKTPDIDILLTDIVMPGSLQGPALAKRLRAINPDLPAVFMSGYPNEATVHGNGLRPEDIRLMKPIPRRELLKAPEKIRARAAGTTGQN